METRQSMKYRSEIRTSPLRLDLRLLDALKLLPAEHVILDGEIAALDEKGRSSFQLLQMFKSSRAVPLVYYAFDLLFLEGKDLRREPLSARGANSLATYSKNLPKYPALCQPSFNSVNSAV